MILLPVPLSTIAKMSESRFIEFCQQTEGKGFLNLVKTEQGYVLIGPYGAYESLEKKILFAQPEHIHALVANWGYKHLVQDGVLRKFQQITT